MNYNLQDLQFNDLQFKFSHVKNGYSPEEVNTVIDTQKRKIDMLIRQNKNLSDDNNLLAQALNECDVRIQQITQSTQLVEHERQKEKLRLADVMTAAGRSAEDILTDARQKAAEIIENANLASKQLLQQTEEDANTAREELIALAHIIQVTRENSNRHYDRLDEVLQSVMRLTAAKQPEQ